MKELSIFIDESGDFGGEEGITRNFLKDLKKYELE